MAADQPNPMEFFQRMFTELFDQKPAASSPMPTPDRQRENLTFALASRAVEALEDIALNTAAIRQRLERQDSTGQAEDLSREEDREGARRARTD